MRAPPLPLPGVIEPEISLDLQRPDAMWRTRGKLVRKIRGSQQPEKLLSNQRLDIFLVQIEGTSKILELAMHVGITASSQCFFSRLGARPLLTPASHYRFFNAEGTVAVME